jgi:hypothetical protein
MWGEYLDTAAEPDWLFDQAAFDAIITKKISDKKLDKLKKKNK